MKLQIIETPDYILAVSDEEIKENDYFHLDMSDNNRPDEIHQMGNNKWSKTGGINFSQSSAWTRCCKKIIAYAPKNNAPELDLPLLPEMVVEDDVEKLLKNEIDYWYKETSSLTSETIIRRSFSMALKAATKKYSEDDFAKVVEYMLKNPISEDLRKELEINFHKGVFVLGEYMKRIIQSLKQPQTPKWFVAEIEEVYFHGSGYYKAEELTEKEKEKHIFMREFRLKTTTINGKTYLVGTYLYE
jgi:hypothetical protein